MEDKKSTANELIIQYGTAVIAAILSMGLGAFTLTSAIARLADAGVSAPSLLSIFGNGSIISIVTGGCLSVFLAVVAKLSLGKIVASKDAGMLVNSRSYHLISQAGQSFCLVFAGLAAVATPATAEPKEKPAKIEARPLRHPWRWVFAGLLIVLGVWFIIASARNEAFGWDTYFQYLFDERIALASLHTIAITILSMIIGVVGGAILAVMRMSPNPVLRSVSWIFLWVFRGTPIYVQLVFWGLLSAIYQSINLGFTEVSLQTILTNLIFISNFRSKAPYPFWNLRCPCWR